MTETPVEVAVGRELDALVAEKVMGFKRYCLGENGRYFLATPEHRAIEWGTLAREASENAERYSDGLRYVPKYSTDIADAWQVALKVAERLRCCFSIDLYGEAEVHVNTFRSGFEPSECSLTPERAAEAICRVALKTLSVMEPS